jgi:acetyltransferase-like isoleucine patch superfamily enzyme
MLSADRRVPHDWFDGQVPEIADIHDEAYLESAFSFSSCRAEHAHAVRIARGAHVYSATIFDVGARGSVSIGECSMLNGARLVCDERIEIGAYAAISWNVIFMDSYRVPLEPSRRRAWIEKIARNGEYRHLLEPADAQDVPTKPITLHDNVWVGFDVCILPGVTIGEGSVVGARSVVTADVPAYMVVAGNPARPIRALPRPTAEEIAGWKP